MSPEVSKALGWITTWTHGDCVVAIRTVSEVRMLAEHFGLSKKGSAELAELERELFRRLDQISPQPHDLPYADIVRKVSG